MFPFKFWNKGAENNKGVVYKYKSIIVKERSDSFMNSSRLIRNAADRLPILFCLDVSASMAVRRDKATSPPITLLNEAVKQLLNQLRDELPMAEVAFLTFSEQDVDYVPFQSLSDLLDLEFHVVADQNGTSLAHAVRKSIEKIEEERRELERLMVKNYAPFLIIVTDGDEGDKQQSDIQQAQDEIYAHTRSRSGERTLIVPFIIGVGENVSLDKLKGYSRGFEEGAFRLKNRAQIQAFRAIFKIVGDSIGSSVDLNADRDTFLDRLGNRVREEIGKAELSEQIRDMWNHFVGGEAMGDDE